MPKAPTLNTELLEFVTESSPLVASVRAVWLQWRQWRGARHLRPSGGPHALRAQLAALERAGAIEMQREHGKIVSIVALRQVSHADSELQRLRETLAGLLSGRLVINSVESTEDLPAVPAYAPWQTTLEPLRTPALNAYATRRRAVLMARQQLQSAGALEQGLDQHLQSMLTAEGEEQLGREALALKELALHKQAELEALREVVAHLVGAASAPGRSHLPAEHARRSARPRS